MRKPRHKTVVLMVEMKVESFVPIGQIRREVKSRINDLCEDRGDWYVPTGRGDAILTDFTIKVKKVS